MPPAVPCVSECTSLATGTPAFVVVGSCSAAVMTKYPRMLVTVLELGLGGDGGQLLALVGDRPRPRPAAPATGPASPSASGTRSQSVSNSPQPSAQGLCPGADGGCKPGIGAERRRSEAGRFEMRRWRTVLGAAVAALVLTSGGAAQAAQELHPTTTANLQAAMHAEAFAYAKYTLFAEAAASRSWRRCSLPPPRWSCGSTSPRSRNCSVSSAATWPTCRSVSAVNPRTLPTTPAGLRRQLRTDATTQPR